MKHSKKSLHAIFVVVGMWLVLLQMQGVLASTTSVSSCQTLSSPGDYVLTQNITATGTCLTVAGSGVHLNCQSFALLGNGSGAGITINQGLSDIDILDCSITRFAVGVAVYHSELDMEYSHISFNTVGALVDTKGQSVIRFNSFENNTLNLNSTDTTLIEGSVLNYVSADRDWWGTDNFTQINASVEGSLIFRPYFTVSPLRDADSDGFPLANDTCPLVANPTQIDSDNDSWGDSCDFCINVTDIYNLNFDNDSLGDACDLDDDNDGIADSSDNCGFSVNANQSDADLDGVGDVCDNCVAIANTDQSDVDLDGFGDSCDGDIDNDNITNSLDNCPSVVNVDQFDTDADGFGDSCDICAFIANQDQTDSDSDGVGDVCDIELLTPLLETDIRTSDEYTGITRVFYSTSIESAVRIQSISVLDKNNTPIYTTTLDPQGTTYMLRIGDFPLYSSNLQDVQQVERVWRDKGSTIGVPYNLLLLYLGFSESLTQEKAQAIVDWMSNFSVAPLDEAMDKNLTEQLNTEVQNYAFIKIDPCKAFAIDCSTTNISSFADNSTIITIMLNYQLNGTPYNVTQNFTLTISPERKGTPHSPGWLRGDMHIHTALSSSSGYNRKIDFLPGVNFNDPTLDDCPQEGFPRIDVDIGDFAGALNAKIVELALSKAGEKIGQGIGTGLGGPVGTFLGGFIGDKVGGAIGDVVGDWIKDQYKDIKNDVLHDILADPGFTIPELADQARQLQIDWLALSDHSYCMRSDTVWSILKADEADVNAQNGGKAGFGKVLVDVGVEYSNREPYRYDKTGPGALEVQGSGFQLAGYLLQLKSGVVLDAFKDREGICANFGTAFNPLLAQAGLTIFNPFLNPDEGRDSTHMNIHNLDTWFGNINPIVPTYARCPISPYAQDSLDIIHSYKNQDGSRPTSTINHARIFEELPVLGLMRWGDHQDDFEHETGIELVNGEFFGPGSPTGNDREKASYEKNERAVKLWVEQLLKGKRTFGHSASDSHRELRIPENERTFLTYVYAEDGTLTKTQLFDNLIEGKSFVSNLGIIDLQIKKTTQTEYEIAGGSVGGEPGKTIDIKVNYDLDYSAPSCTLKIIRGIIGDTEETIDLVTISGSGTYPSGSPLKQNITNDKVYYRATCEYNGNLLVDKVKEPGKLDIFRKRLREGINIAPNVNIFDREFDVRWIGLRAFTNPIWVNPFFVNSSYDNGQEGDLFKVGQTVYAKGRAFNSTSGNLLVMEDNGPWVDQDPVGPIEHQVSNVVLPTDANYFEELWPDTKLENVGKYDLLADTDKDSIFDATSEALDGEKDTGFTITCQDDPTTDVCGTVLSSDNLGVKKNLFFIDQGNVYAKIKIFTGSVLPQNPAILLIQADDGLQQGLDLVSVTKKSVPITLLASTYNKKVITLGAASTSDIKEGYYDLVIDVNSDGIFQEDQDIFDPDGLTVTNEFTEPRIAVDSKGNLHVVALMHAKADPPASYRIDRIMYTKIPADKAVRIDMEHPELFDWSEAQDLTLTKIREQPGAYIGFPDIAVDSKDEAHIIYGIHLTEFDWLMYTKLDNESKPDRCMDRSDQLTPPAADKSNCDGSGLELLYYHWDDFEDYTMSFPSIAIDKTTDQPVISSKVGLIYPDTFYFNYIYPSCFIGFEFVPVLVTIPILLPLPLTLNSAPIQFYGDSVAVARRIPGHPGTAQWPYGGGTYDAALKKFLVASNEVSNCLGDIATVSPRGDENWEWITVDESHSIAGGGFDVSKVAVDSQGDIHVLFRNQTAGKLKYARVQGLQPTVVDVSANPTLWYPWIDIDSNDIAHFVWQSGYDIKYNTMDDLSLGNEKTIATVSTLASARPSMSLDTEDVPHIVWVEQDNQQNTQLKYTKGKIVFSAVTFPDPPVTLVDSVDFPDGGSIRFPVVDTNKKAKQNDWEDKTFVAWLEFSDQLAVKYKRTTPHILATIVMDGLDTDTFGEHLDQMPTLEGIINSDPGINGTITGSLLTTMSSHASLFTGVKPRTHLVVGDEFPTTSSDKFYDDNSPATSEVNSFMQVPTVFDALEAEHRTKAAIPAIITKGITSTGSDKIIDADIDFSTGQVSNDGDTASYFVGKQNMDWDNTNDIASVLSVYLLAHDHGINTKADDINFASMDNNIRNLIDKLDQAHALQDTIFIFTSDHGLTDSVKDDTHSLDNTDLSTLINPTNVFLTPLFLNGRVAYSTGTIDVARVYSNNTQTSSSIWSNAIQAIYFKDASNVYQDYHFNGTDDVFVTATDPLPVGIVSSSSPSIILVAATDYYFAPPSVASVGELSTLPFIVAGQGTSLFRQGDPQLPGTANMEDVAPTIAYFAGGQNAIEQMGAIDGESIFVPDLEIEGGSPVNIHLYDSLGRHLGLDVFGNIESTIPSGQFEISPVTGKKHLSVLSAPDSYRVEVDSYGYGSFGLRIRYRSSSGTYSITYPQVSITPKSFVRLPLNGSFDMEVDENGDGVFESVVSPPRLVVIDKNAGTHSATLNFIHQPANDPTIADAFSVTDAGVQVLSSTPTSGIITLQEQFNTSLNGPAFFTFDKTLSVNSTISAKTIRLIMQYTDTEAAMRSIAIPSLAVYHNGVRLPSSVDDRLNRVTADVVGPGVYILAASDRTPSFVNLTITPSATNQINASVHVSVIITDDGSVVGARASLGGQTVVLTLNNVTGAYEGDLTGPSAGGIYPVDIEATDNTNNIAKTHGQFILDLSAPRVTIFSPENMSYVTNRINLSIGVDEKANGTYTVDGNVPIPLINLAPHHVVTIPLVLASGPHAITVQTTDQFGNLGTVQIAFSIDQANLLLSPITTPLYEKPGVTVHIQSEVSNTMIQNVSFAEVQLWLNGNYSSSKNFSLASESSKPIDFVIQLAENRYTVELRAIPLAGETFLADNNQLSDLLITSKVPILFVDDADGTNEQLYQQAIQSSTGIGFDYITYNVSARGPPAQSLLGQFRLTVWVADAISPLEQSAITAYQQSRGSLLLFSPTAGSLPKSFLQSFGVQFQRPSPTRTIEGAFRDPIGQGMLFSLNESGDEVKAISPGTESLRYSGGESAAVRQDTGFYKTVLMTFVLEQVNDPTIPNVLVDRSLNWFGVDFTPPALLSISPPQNFGFPINTPNVTISIQTDENAECRYSPSSTSFDLMTPFSQTGAAVHNTVISVQNGFNYTLQLNCRDGFHNENATSVTFFIYNRTFLPPVLVPVADQQLKENQTLIIQVNVTDPENDPIQLSLQDVEIFGFVPIAYRFQINGSTLTLKTNFTDAGTYLIRLIAADGYSTSTDDFQVVVDNVNRKPQLTHPGNLTLQEDAYFQLQLQATDPDGDSIIFSENTPLFDIAPLGLIGVTPRQAAVGTYTINFTVSDGNLADSKIAVWTVQNVNDPPIVEFIPPQTATENVLFNYQVRATDEDSNFTFADNTTLFNITTTGLISFIPLSTQKGTYFINISVSDSTLSVGRLLNLVILGVNQAPNITQITNVTVQQNSYLIINITACDKDLDPNC